MPQYEVIYEDGSHSVANYDSDEEALSACEAHHNRALSGEGALANSPEVNVRATRVVKVLAYDAPPGDLLQAQAMPTDQVESELKALLEQSSEDGVTDLRGLAARIRDLSNPFVQDSAPHESNYKAQEARELELSWS